MALKKTEMPDFRKVAEEVLKDAPKEVAERARAFFMSSFIKEGFTDASFIPWPKRKDSESHKILSLSLALRNTIKIERADLNRIEISAGKGIAYAAIHNNGGTVTVPVTEKMRKYFWYMYKKTGDAYWKNAALTKKKHFVIRIPKRQFIGNSYQLMKQVDAWMLNNIKKAEKQLNF